MTENEKQLCLIIKVYEKEMGAFTLRCATEKAFRMLQIRSAIICEDKEYKDFLLGLIKPAKEEIEEYNTYFSLKEDEPEEIPDPADFDECLHCKHYNEEDDICMCEIYDCKFEPKDGEDE